MVVPHPTAANDELAREQARAALALFERLKELMGEWSRASKSASDDAVIGVAEYYQSRCQEMDALIAQAERAVTPSTGFDPASLREARRHIALVLAVDARRILRAERDVREGRTTSLERMRRELRNPTR
jgi:hypothetical protein